jgi:hypothetical protein
MFGVERGVSRYPPPMSKNFIYLSRLPSHLCSFSGGGAVAGLRVHTPILVSVTVTNFAPPYDPLPDLPAPLSQRIDSG